MDLMQQGFSKISIVIPTYNRAPLLQDCLCSLERLDYPRESFEVIVVNDGSADNTEDLLRKFAQTTQLNFSHINQGNSGPSSARNRGWKSAQHDLIAFTDDDCMVDASWLRELVAAFPSEEFGAIGGLIRTRSRGCISDYMEFHSVIKSDISNNRFPPFVITANACYRKKVLETVGGFDENLRHPGGEDPDLSWRAIRAGFKMGFSEKAVVLHASNRKFSEFLQSFYHYAHGHAYLVRKHGLAGEKDSLWEDIVKSQVLSPVIFLYRIKQYFKAHRLGFLKSIVFSIFDTLRQIAALAGYWSYKETALDAKIGIQKRGETHD